VNAINCSNQFDNSYLTLASDMIKNRITLILGAGASQPFGFPNGQELVTRICESLIYKRAYETRIGGGGSTLIGNVNVEIKDDTKSSNKLVQLLIDAGYEKNYIENFRTSLLLSQLNSIDSFLERRVEFIPIGKMVISYLILNYEIHDNIFNNSNWYRILWNSINAPFDEFELNNLNIITFNYDRSFEYYLFNTIKNSYGKDDDETIKKLNSIGIIHVHGKLGNVFDPNANDYTKFGERVNNFSRLKQISDNIKIIHEDMSDSPEFNAAFQTLFNSERIYFMGFGYGKTNIERLKINFLDENKAILGTAFKMTNRELANIKKLFTSHGIGLYSNFDCVDFMRNHEFD
jgi:hypothetical protein